VTLIQPEDFEALEASEGLRTRLASFARDAVARIRHEGFGASVEIGPGFVKIMRDGAQAASLALTLTLDARGVEVALRVPSSQGQVAKDFENLRASSRIPELALALASVLEELPEPFAMGPSGEALQLQSPVMPDAIRAAIERSQKAGLPFWVGWFLSRDLADANAETLDEELEDAFIALVPLAKLISWDETNDYLLPERPRLALLRPDDLEEESVRARPKTPSFAPEDEDEDLPEPSVQVPYRPLERVMLSHAPAPRFLRRAALVTEVDPSIVVEKGTRVRVLVGPFMGKVGVVQSLNAKGRARVLLGLLSTSCDVADLIAAREGDRKRLPMRSSHRTFKRGT
jgi:hypothetical protein